MRTQAEIEAVASLARDKQRADDDPWEQATWKGVAEALEWAADKAAHLRMVSLAHEASGNDSP